MIQLFIFAFSLLILAAAPAFAEEATPPTECTPAIKVLQTIDNVKPILDGKVVSDAAEVAKLAELEGITEKGYTVAAALAHGHADFTLLFGYKVDPGNPVLCEGHTVPPQKLREFLAIVAPQPKARPVPGNDL